MRHVVMATSEMSTDEVLHQLVVRMERMELVASHLVALVLHMRHQLPEPMPGQLERVQDLLHDALIDLQIEAMMLEHVKQGNERPDA